MSWLVVALAACSSTTSPPPAGCADGGACQSSDSSPRILTINTNTTKLDEHGTLAVTAVVTDPDGVDDLIGGALVDPDSGSTYGAFATSAAEGAYEINLTWGAIEQVRDIDTPIGGATRDFRARFYDQGGNTAEESVTVMLHCSMSGYALCGGACVDLGTDPENCGKCGNTIPDGAECVGGQPGCVMGPENTAAACSDGCSNDGDAYIDCNDYDCCDVVTCAKGTTCNP
jgi:hypothetical protein